MGQQCQDLSLHGKSLFFMKAQIKKYEEDIKNGVVIDINEYLVVDKRKYNNTLSKLASKLSDSISKIVNNSVEYTFKYISRLIDE